MFVNDVDRCYRLKLFLEQFSIKSCVLNSELPLNSRYVLSLNWLWFVITFLSIHIVQEFNKGVYDYIIATDEANVASVREEDNDTDDDADEDEEPECKFLYFFLFLFSYVHD